MQDSVIDEIKSKFPNLILGIPEIEKDPCIFIKKEGVLPLARSLKTDPKFRFNMLMDLFAVDYLHWEEKETRFEVVYNLFSLETKQRLFLKVPVSEKEPEIDSVVSVWLAADWFEREVWDMMGIRFKGHPNLKRILMYEEFTGHPLRKDYRYNQRQPLIGPMN